jgi:hypothetical protein
MAEIPTLTLQDIQGGSNQNVPTLNPNMIGKDDEDDSLFDSAVNFAEDTVSTFGDIAQGVGAGLIGLPQGIVETVTSGFDYIFDTDSTRDVTAFSEGTKEFLGLTPEGTAGKVAEGITTFGSALIPVIGLGWSC